MNNYLIRVVVASIVALFAGGLNYWYLDSQKPRTEGFLYFKQEIARGDALVCDSPGKNDPGNNVGIFSVAFNDKTQQENFQKIFIPQEKWNLVDGLSAARAHRQNTPILSGDFRVDDTPPNYDVLGPFRFIDSLSQDGETIAVAATYDKNDEKKFDSKTRRLMQIVTNQNKKTNGDLKILAVVSYPETNDKTTDASAQDKENAETESALKSGEVAIYVPIADLRGVSQIVGGQTKKIGFAVPESAALQNNGQ